MKSAQFPATLSTYMNLVRWLAASGVVFYHAKGFHFGSPWLNAHLPPNGKAYVMAFFVISGFVIAHAVERRSATEFLIDRSARIYSVALPVLVACFLLSIFRPDLAPGYGRQIEHPIETFFLNASFLSQSWISVVPYINDPYWSLPFEVFYYVIFALWSYCTGPARWVAVLLSCALAGPQILLLFPCWLFGVAVYRLRSVPLSSALAWTLAVGTPLALALAMWSGLNHAANNLSAALLRGGGAYASEFLRNWIVAAVFAAHLLGVHSLRIPLPKFVAKAAVEMAEMSYSLYLVHYPVLVITAGCIANTQTNLAIIELAAAVYISCYAFSLLTEGKRHQIKGRLKHLLVQFDNPAKNVVIEKRSQPRPTQMKVPAE
jgi:peptidoglycan/LPS O-acetylase OafA/YrhL